MSNAEDASNPLNLLLKAPSQPAVQRLFNTAFRFRHAKLKAESPVLGMIAGELDVTEAEALKVSCAQNALVGRGGGDVRRRLSIEASLNSSCSPKHVCLRARSVFLYLVSAWGMCS